MRCEISEMKSEIFSGTATETPGISLLNLKTKGVIMRNQRIVAQGRIPRWRGQGVESAR